MAFVVEEQMPDHTLKFPLVEALVFFYLTQRLNYRRASVHPVTASRTELNNSDLNWVFHVRRVLWPKSVPWLKAELDPAAKAAQMATLAIAAI